MLNDSNYKIGIQLDLKVYNSEVMEWFGCGVLWDPSSVLCFDINLTSQNLCIPTYNKHQHFLYETITNLRNKELNDVEIANWLNDNGHQAPRGHSFKNNHVHSIAKKRKRCLDILELKLPKVDFLSAGSLLIL